VVEVEHHDAKSSRVEHVLDGTKGRTVIRRRNPEHAIEIDTCRACPMRIERVWKIDPRGTFTREGHCGDQDLRKSRSSGRYGSKDLSNGATGQAAIENRVEFGKRQRETNARKLQTLGAKVAN
jgi:hypothetical protein